jgi:hypothetical protein
LKFENNYISIFLEQLLFYFFDKILEHYFDIVK